MTDDEREAREWLAWAENRQKQNTGKYKYVENDDARHRATILALLDRPRSKRERMLAAMDACIVEMKRIRDEEDRDGR